MNEKKQNRWRSPIVTLLVEVVLAYATLMVGRLAYLAENWSFFAGARWAEIFRGALLFDTSAMVYGNALWIALLLLPIHWKERRPFHLFLRALFVVVNTLMLVANLADAVYFRFTMRRTTSTVFSEFAGEDNLAGIFGIELLRHWYFVLLAIIVAIALWKLYRMPAAPRHLPAYYISQTLALVVAVPLCIGGIRGGFSTAVRPITISNARQYASRPTDAALVLNTPFSIIRTIGKNVFEVPSYFASEQEMEQVFTPVHRPEPSAAASPDSASAKRKNIVVIIVESFGREYIGALNPPGYDGYTPCIDSIVRQSVTFRYSFCNGRKSIDGMPSILSSIPMFVEPFVLTPAAMNHVEGLASLLARKGYSSAFFHGAQRGSMGFQAFARSIGFQQYYGREDYNADPRFGGDADFDGTWAIWDEPFLQYFCAKMGEMKQPFATALFTASSHHPFVVPKQYSDKFPEEGLPIHKCIRYTDYALGRFFQEARRQPWFDNTIFVLTSDHTNLSDHAYYQTDIGGFASPIIIYDPSGERPPQIIDAVAQQTDILPTLLGMVGFDEPYLAFGCDLFATPKEQTYAVNYLAGIYQYVKNGYVMQFDGRQTRAIYSLDDSLMQRNLIGTTAVESQMERELKAIIQQYMMRMTTDRLTANP